MVSVVVTNYHTFLDHSFAVLVRIVGPFFSVCVLLSFGHIATYKVAVILEILIVYL